MTTSCCAPGAEIFEGVGRAQVKRGGQGGENVVSSQSVAIDSPTVTGLPVVTVTESELQNIAKTKKCPLAGVSFENGTRRWNAQFTEGGKNRFVHFTIGRFVKQGLSEDGASLAALRAAIAARNEKVLPACAFS